MTKSSSSPAEQPLVFLIGQGCAKNQVDTETAAGGFLCAGFGITQNPDEASVLFLNTCAFLAASRKEAEQTICQALAWKKEHPRLRKVIVGGCLVEWDRDGVFRKRFPGVDLWTGIDAPADLGELARNLLSGEKIPSVVSAGSAKWLYNHETPRILLNAGHYAHLKIADGCDNRCTYCLIPSIRGNLRSRVPESVLAEAQSLIDGGTRELIVIAQDTAGFGRDAKNGSKFPDLLRKLDNLNGDYLLRVMYLHPAGMTDELVNTLIQCEHLAPCIEMPIQHIADSVLKRMNRHISESALRTLLDKLAEQKKFAVRTTLMVGFPGETEEDYRKLYDLVAEHRFQRLGVFQYSPEKGSPAFDFPDRVPEKTTCARREELMRLQSGISLEDNRALVGKTVETIVDETHRRGKGIGRTLLDAPDIDNTVHFDNSPNDIREGDRIPVRITEAGEYDLYGKADFPEQPSVNRRKGSKR